MRIHILRPNSDLLGTTGAFSTWVKYRDVFTATAPVAKSWKPPRLRLQTMEEFHDPSTHTKAASKKLYEQGLPDFATGMEHTYSERAMQVLEPWFLPHGEFLPVKIVGDKRPFFYYHCFHLCEALDVAKSHVNLPDDEPSRRNVHELGYVFDAKKLKGFDAFRLTYLAARSLVFVSQTVLDAVAMANLTGFACVELWRSADEPPIPRSRDDRKIIERWKKK